MSNVDPTIQTLPEAADAPTDATGEPAPVANAPSGPDTAAADPQPTTAEPADVEAAPADTTADPAVLDPDVQPGADASGAGVPVGYDAATADRPEAATDDTSRDPFVSQDDVVAAPGAEVEHRAGSEDHDRGFLATAGQATASAEALAERDRENGVERTSNVWEG